MADLSYSNMSNQPEEPDELAMSEPEGIKLTWDNDKCDKCEDDGLGEYCGECIEGVYQEQANAKLKEIMEQVFKELETVCPHDPDPEAGTMKHECYECFEALKSKWGIA